MLCATKAPEIILDFCEVSYVFVNSLSLRVHLLLSMSKKTLYLANKDLYANMKRQKTICS